MKNISKLFTILLFLGFAANAQDFAKVDNIVKAYPKAFTSLDRIAGRVNNDFKTEEDKARALFAWIAINVKYDYPKMERMLDKDPVTINSYLPDDKAALKTLIQRKGVCMDYALLYKVLAEKVGLEAFIINGFAKNDTKDIGLAPVEINHAWNAVKIKGEWKLLDTTWGTGAIYFGANARPVFELDNSYFFSDPVKLSLNHFPEDKAWLFADTTFEDYIQFPVFYDINFEVITPKRGVLKKSETSSISFRVKNIKSEDIIAYTFEEGGIGIEIEPEIVDDVANFSILLNQDSGKQLFIYVNSDCKIAYSIE